MLLLWWAFTFLSGPALMIKDLAECASGMWRKGITGYRIVGVTNTSAFFISHAYGRSAAFQTYAMG
jgi:hypothetical protein